MENKIELNFENSITILAGNSFGQKTFTEQVKRMINYDSVNTIIIPNVIENIAISFVQGFTNEIFNHISKDDFPRHFIIEAEDKVKKKFLQAVFF